MRFAVATMYPEVATATQDRKRKRDDSLPASDLYQVPGLHIMQSSPTSFMPEDLHPKRQHLLSEEPQPLQMMSTVSIPQKQSLSGSVTSSQPSEQTDLHITASDGNSIGKQGAVTVMEVDQQSTAPAPQQQHRDPTRGSGMSHSTSAPDLRLILATELPDNRPMYLPAPGSYAGALVPYTSPEQTIAEAHQHVTTNLINRMIDQYRGAEAHQDTDNAESMVMNLESAAYGQAPALHTALQGNMTDLRLQTRKRKYAELPSCPSKWARRSDSHTRMVLDSDCEVEMELN